MTPAERRSVHFSLLDHTARHLSRLLPGHLAMVAAPEQLILTSTADGPARTVATGTLHAPEQLDASTIGVVAHHVLTDAQDLVIEHLHEPWPTGADGRPLHAFASASGRSVRLGFRPTASDEDAVALPDFPIPDGAAGPVRPAG